MWLEECRGNRGVCGKQGFHSSMVTPWPLQEQDGSKQAISANDNSSTTPPEQSRARRRQYVIHTCIYHWSLSGARVHWTSRNLCPPPKKKDPAGLKVYTVGLTFRLGGWQLLQQSKPVCNLMGKTNENTEFLGNNRASNMDADAKQLREKWYPSQCKHYISLMAAEN